MADDVADTITPRKTRQNQRRSTSEAHVHPQDRTPSLQDKPIPDLSPPTDQRQASGGIAPSKSRHASLGSPKKSRDSEDGLSDLSASSEKDHDERESSPA